MPSCFVWTQGEQFSSGLTSPQWSQQTEKLCPCKHVHSSPRGWPPRGWPPQSTEWKADVNGGLCGQQALRDGKTAGAGCWSRCGEGWVRRESKSLRTQRPRRSCPSSPVFLKRRNDLSGQNGESQHENNFSLNQRVP